MASAAYSIGSAVFSQPFSSILEILVALGLTLAAAYAVMRFVRLSAAKAFPSDKESIDKLFQPFSYVLYLVVSVIALAVFAGVEELAYVAVLVLVILIIYSWRLLLDLSSYYALQLRRPALRPGSLVELPKLGVRGRISSVKLTHVTLRTAEGSVIYIPNSLLVSEPLILMTTPQGLVTFEVVASMDYEELEKIDRELRSKISERIPEIKPQDVEIVLREIQEGKARINVRVILRGVEPKPTLINRIVSVLVLVLRDRNPYVRIRLWQD
ncbi:MAG: mechanosensitive ion channel domain-containing protein [Thermoproteota archaeon]